MIDQTPFSKPWHSKLGFIERFHCGGEHPRRLRVVGFCSWNPRRVELLILCKLGKETRREWGEARASRGFAARARPSLIATLATLGKERDCSHSSTHAILLEQMKVFQMKWLNVFQMCQSNEKLQPSTGKPTWSPFCFRIPTCLPWRHFMDHEMSDMLRPQP